MSAEATLSNGWGQDLIVLVISAFHVRANERSPLLVAMGLNRLLRAALPQTPTQTSETADYRIRTATQVLENIVFRSDECPDGVESARR